MSKLLAITIALGLAIAYAAPVACRRQSANHQVGVRKRAHEVGRFDEDLLEGQHVRLTQGSNVGASVSADAPCFPTVARPLAVASAQVIASRLR